jgi:hypothetical protein
VAESLAQRNGQDLRSSVEQLLMTSVDYVVLSVGLIVAAIAVCSLPWLCQWLVRNLRHSLRNSTGGGAAYNPLQEMIQPQIHHVIEVQQQRLKEDQSGSPPSPD